MMNNDPSFDDFDIEKIASSSSLSTANQQSQGVAALLVMLAVLFLIFAYCCWGAPFCRNICKKYCYCQLEDPDAVDVSQFVSNDERSQMVATPTIILLPHGRMLVVDTTVFNQFQADNTGLDLVELSEHAIRNQLNNNPRIINRHQLQSSQGSILTTDSESLSKDNRFPPPTYESIYGKEEGSFPPSYSDILLHRFATLPYDINVIETYRGSKEEFEMQSLENEQSHLIQNPVNNIYLMGNNFSNQSIAGAILSRNSSLTSNSHTDGYFLNNQIPCLHFEQNVSQINSYSCLNINTISSLQNNSNSREELQHLSRNELSLQEENYVQNETANSRNIARDEPQSNFNLEIDQTFRNSENNERNRDIYANNNRILSIDGEDFVENSLQNQTLQFDSTDCEDSRDFQVLADIRESRV